MAPLVHLPPSTLDFLTPYLPPSSTSTNSSHPPTRPFLTLTYATTLDSALSLPGTQLALSSPETKALTHHLRTHHSSILIGAQTAIVDNPGLNSRVEGAGLNQQPRPIILDPKGRWIRDVTEETRVVRTAREGQGKGVWVFVGEEVEVSERVLEVVERFGGGRVVRLPLKVDEGSVSRWRFKDVMGKLFELGIESVMVEGGAGVIDAVLEEEVNTGEVGALVDSVIVTVVPGFLGGDAVKVGPGVSRLGGGEGKERLGLRLKDVKWGIVGNDAVVCGRIGGKFRRC